MLSTYVYMYDYLGNIQTLCGNMYGRTSIHPSSPDQELKCGYRLKKPAKDLRHLLSRYMKSWIRLLWSRWYTRIQIHYSPILIAVALLLLFLSCSIHFAKNCSEAL